VLDICCGTGTIGICALKNSSSQGVQESSRSVAPLLLGIELCAAAIENSKKNAQINGMNYKCDLIMLHL
jgi:methylase of polypeptide subunit release factors